MVKIAQLSQQLGTNFPCGDANHNGRYEIYGVSAWPTTDSLVVYEYEGSNQFQRVGSNTMVAGGPWWFGDGDNDGLMEVIGDPYAGCAVIWESLTPDSLPSESICLISHQPAAGYCRPKYADLDRDGHQEIITTEFNTRIFEHVGDNRYDSVATLDSAGGDVAIGDFDGDSLTDIVASHFPYCQIYVFEATGQDNQYHVVARCSTETYRNTNFAAAHDMDGNCRPEFIAVGGGQDSLGGDFWKVMVYEAVAHAQYQRIWEQTRYDFDMFGPYTVSVGDADGDEIEEFAVNSGAGRVILYKCSGLHSYSQVWRFDSAGVYERLFDINRDGRAEVIFDGPNGTEIWEDTEGLAVAEFAKYPQESPVGVAPSVARLGASLQFSGFPPDADVEIHSLDGRLVRRTQGVRQSTWTWDLRNQSGNLVPAGTYFAVIRSKGTATSLKLCVVK